jgi:hypothetical protein
VANRKLETSPDSSQMVVEQVQLIVTFFSWRHKDDIERLVALSRRISVLNSEKLLSIAQIQTHLLPLTRIILDSLQRYDSRQTY